MFFFIALAIIALFTGNWLWFVIGLVYLFFG